MENDPRAPDRGGPTARWYVVVPILFATFGAMLAAIYWVVKSAPH